MMENIELNEMREQIDLLKKKLDKETIVNERLLRETINGKVAKITTQEMVTYIAATSAILLCSFAFRDLQLPMYVIGGTVLLMIVAIIANFILHYRLHNTDFVNGNLLSAAKTVKQLKKGHMTWLMIGVPLGLAWIIWLFYELSKVNDGNFIFMIISGSIGLILGSLIGFTSYRKTIRACDEVISQIEQ